MMSKTLIAFLLALPAATLAAPATLNARAAEPQLKVALSAADTVENVNGATVTAVITNTGAEDVTLVNDPASVVSTWKTNTFAVHVDGEAAQFDGYVVKSDLSKVDRTTIPAGQSVSVEHVLGGAYNFATAGKYTVEALSNTLTFVDTDGSLKTIEVEVDSADSGFHLKEVDTVLDHEIAVLAKTGEKFVETGTPAVAAGKTKRASYPSCSSSRQTQIQQAVTAAKSYLSDALSTLSSSTSSNPGTRYTTWFGAWTSSRHSTVTSHFTNINNQNWDSFTFDCGCTESGTWAYVQPSVFGTIHLCLEFWNHAAENVQDSKGGTLIHESSHFTKNGGTDDIVYQPSGCKSLAKSNPAQAVQNADSHEYFCESRGGVVS